MALNLLAQKNEIKKSLIEQTGRLWGYTDLNEVDPLVRLLLDAFAYEVSKVGQVITESNDKILEHLTSLLIPNDAMLSLPSHAILTALPSSVNTYISNKNQFYYPNGLRVTSKTKIQGDIFFTPVQETPLFDGHVAHLIHRGTMKCFNKFGGVQQEFKTLSREELTDGEVWLGIKVNDVAQDLTALQLYLDAAENNSELLPFNSLIRAQLYRETSGAFHDLIVEVGSRKKERYDINSDEKDRIIEGVIDCYDHHFLSLSQHRDKQYTAAESTCQFPEILKERFHSADIEELDQQLIWLKLVFPPVYTRVVLEQITILINCVIVANIKSNYYQHNFSRSGRVLPIELNKGDYFFAIEVLNDSHNVSYSPSSAIDKLETKAGTYKMYHGNLTGSGREQGLLTLERLIYKIREEGDSFSALGIDTISTELADVHERLNAIEKKIERKREGSEIMENYYVLADPIEGSTTAFLHYWTVNAEYANGIPQGTELQQYRNTNLIKPGGLRLLTQTIGGRKMVQDQSLVHYLRHKTISKERLISTSDIRFFVLQELHHLIDDVEITAGVMIGKDPKKGIVRCTDIWLHPKETHALSNKEWQVIIQGLSRQISRKAMSGLQHRIKLKTT